MPVTIVAAVERVLMPMLTVTVSLQMLHAAVLQFHAGLSEYVEQPVPLHSATKKAAQRDKLLLP